MKAVTAALMGIVMMGFGTAWGAHFNNPGVNGYALDWCSTFENGCGKPAADLYCKKKGYVQSTSFVKRPMVNVFTMTIGENSICNPAVHVCDSFVSIDCQEQTKIFVQPKTNGYRLDWCKTFEQGCGAMAASTFCQKNGYPQLVNFQKQDHLNVQTMTIGEHSICNPAYHVCDGFKFIQCKK